MIQILDIEKVISLWYRCDTCGSEDFAILDTSDYYAGKVSNIQCDICLSRHKLSEEELREVSSKFEELIE